MKTGTMALWRVWRAAPGLPPLSFLCQKKEWVRRFAFWSGQ